MPQVSLSTSTSFDNDLNALVEDQGTALTIRFDLDEPAPEGGLNVYVDSEVEQIINRLDLPGFTASPTVENIDPTSFVTNFDNSGFALTIVAGATFGTFTIDVFDNPEPDTFLPATFDGRVEAALSLRTQTEVDPADQNDITEVGDYTIDPNGASSTVIFADEASQLTNTPTEPPVEPPTEPSPSDTLQVSLFTGPDYLIEDESTVSAHAFNVTNGIIPEGGLIVSVDAPNLSEFDLDSISVEGGEIAAVRNGGFDLRMTEYTTLVNLAITDDGETETGETASFSLAAGDGYEIVEDYSAGSFELVDTRADIPRGVVTEPNDVVAVATDTQITPENPSFFGSDSVYFGIGNRYLNEDGTYTYVDYNDDVDLYQVKLKAGDTIAVEVFEVEGNHDVNDTHGSIPGAAIFDTEGNRLIASGLFTPAAPDKLFGSGVGAFNEDGTVNESHTANYIEFTAPEDSVYYVGVSSYLSATEISYGTENQAYDINVPGSGGNNRVAYGNYEVAIDLLTEDNPRRTGTPTPPVSNPDAVNPPTLSLDANPTTVDAEGNFTSAVVEFVETDGLSGVTFTIRADGEIPEEGIEFILNSDANLFDYVSYLTQDRLPSTVGGQSLGAYYDENGIPTGIRLRIERPTMTVNLERANRNARSNFQHDTEQFYDLFEGLETDGIEEVNFFIQSGEGYEVASEAGTTEITYYDSVADVPPPSAADIIPEVGLTISETELLESEGTETTLTFTLSQPPPAEGVTVSVNSEDELVIGSVLGQFDVLNAEIDGGNFPIPNSSESGFLFTITEQTATITLSVFDELSVIDNPLTVQEGILDLTFNVLPQAGYTVDPDASSINLTIADNPDSKIQVSLTGFTEADEESTDLVESESTVSIHTFSLSSPPPEEGLTVSVGTESLDDFDLDSVDVTGGTINNLREDGFDLTITERQATIALSVLDDGLEEGGETATFTLESSGAYEINQAAAAVTFGLADTPDQVVGVSEELEGNDTLTDANGLSLSTLTPTVSISGALNAFGSPDETPARWLGFAEDVDFYSVALEADQTVTFDIDGEAQVFNDSLLVYPSLDGLTQTPDTELRLFDADGNELAANNDGAASDEVFSRDPFLAFTASEAGTYYVGVSQLGNRNYDPFTVRSGSGWTFPEVGVFYGDYELTATLIEGNNGQPPTDGDITGTDAADTLIGDTTANTINALGGDDTVAGDLGDDIITGSGGDDILRGDLNDRTTQDDGIGGNDIIFGGEGSDRIGGKSGNDILSGDAGDDFIWGDAGDDIIMGVTGDDILVGDNFSGGSGSDLFVFGNGDGTDTILDFEVGSDRIGLVEGELTFGDLTITQDGRNTLLGIADSGEVIAKLHNVQASALTESSFAVVPDVSNPEEAMALI